MRTNYLETHRKASCCGCRACEQICPVNAINMTVDNEGFLYPHVDFEKCINCSLCSKVCPIDNPQKAQNKQGSFFVAFNNKRSQLLKSSSGGVFSVIAEYVLSKEGVVYGAAFQQSLSLRHIRVENIMGIEVLRGSKYVQSDTKNTFIQVKEDLKKGRFVYYVGTGCQIAGLKLFLRKEYDNLITSDLVCHGTPSQKMFHIFVDFLQKKKHLELIDYKFRDKRVNGWSCSSSSSSSRGETIWWNKIMNAYTNAFLSGSINREACYECPFACGERCGDITLADFWSVKKHHPKIDYQYGVSCISVNTKKGEEILKNIEPGLTIERSNYEWAVDENHNLEGKTPRPQYRDVAYKEAFEDPEDFIKKFEDKDDTKKRIKFELKRFLKKNNKFYQVIRRIKKKIIP